MPVELTLETITPLFLGGAEPNYPELRPASVRGALRFWLRALLGGEVGDDTATLYEQESAVFGTTDQASPVVVRISGKLREMGEFEQMLTRKGTLSGFNYFFYSTRLKPNRRVPLARDLFAKPEDTPRLILQPRAKLDDARSLQLAAASAWLLTNLGSLGTRARRCGGSIQVAKDGAVGALDGLPPFEVTAKDADGLCEHLLQGLKKVRALVGTPNRPSLKYDVLHPDTCRVWVIRGEGKGWLKWDEAVEAIGSAMRNFREVNPGKNAIFGLPVGRGGSSERRSSPLWLRVTRLDGGEHVGIATLFKADFQEGRHEVGGGYGLIEEFVSERLKGQEV